MSVLSNIWMCIILAGSCKEEGSSCTVFTFDYSHLVPNSSSEDVSWNRFQNSSSVKGNLSSSVTITISSLSWT